MKNSIPAGVEVNRYLASALESRKWTQAEASAFLGVSNQMFCRLIRNEYSCSDDSRNTILSEEFGLKIFELTGHLVDEVFPKKAGNQEVLFCEIESELLLSVRDVNPDPEQITDAKLLRYELLRALKTLSSKESIVINLRFFEDKTLEEVGALIKVTRERVRQIEARALRRLRHPAITRKVRDFIINGTCYRCGYLITRCRGECRVLQKKR